MAWTDSRGNAGLPKQPPKTLRLVKQSEDSPKTGAILSIPAQELMDTLSVALAAGCGVLISPTSDGGALSVTLYAADQRHRAYASSAEDFHTILEAVRDVSEAHMVGGPMRAVNGPLQSR
jgi:hypothetical protein